MVRWYWLTAVILSVVAQGVRAEEPVPAIDPPPAPPVLETQPTFLERLREGPMDIPAEGPRPNQYGEAMVLPPLVGSASKFPSVQMGGVFQITSVFYSQTETNRQVLKNEDNLTTGTPHCIRFGCGKC